MVKNLSRTSALESHKEQAMKIFKYTAIIEDVQFLMDFPIKLSYCENKRR